MKKNIVIILIIVSTVLCTCPALAGGVFSLYSMSSPEKVASIIASGQQVRGTTDNPPQEVIDTIVFLDRIVSGSVICLGLVIPVVVGWITYRMARKKEAASTPPSQ